MPLGTKLHSHTDHLNITTINTTPPYIICLLNCVEQYNLSGKDNIADMLFFGSTGLKSLFFLEETKSFSSKTKCQKGWTLQMTISLSSVSYIFLLYQFKILNLLTTIGPSPNRMNQMSYSGSNKNFLKDTSIKYLMTENIIVILHPLMTGT